MCLQKITKNNLPDANERGQRTALTKSEKIEELDGSLKKSDRKESKLMSTVDKGNADKDKGKVAEEMVNKGIGSFTPDMMFQNLVNNYKNAKKLFGETIIREITDFEPGYIERNVNIPEFKTQLKKNITNNINSLKDKGVLAADYTLTQKGLDYAAMYLCDLELEELKLKGQGKKRIKETDKYGIKEDYADFNKNSRYRDIAIAQTVKNAARRKHKKILKEDIKINERKKTGKVDIIYCIDSSGSMKGNKLSMSKKAGIALAYKAINDKNKVGIISFDSEIRTKTELTKDFNHLLSELIKIRASNQTNLTKVIETATKLLEKSKNAKHIVILSDAMTNVGDKPKKEVLESAAIAKSKEITISFMGIGLKEKDIQFVRQLVDIGKGRFYRLNNTDNLDLIILDDYDFAKR
jgi:Mg-chelatase subunit ChlD